MTWVVVVRNALGEAAWLIEIRLRPTLLLLSPLEWVDAAAPASLREVYGECCVTMLAGWREGTWCETSKV